MWMCWPFFVRVNDLFRLSWHGVFIGKGDEHASGKLQRDRHEG